MRCPSCQNENAVGAAYCDMCGFDLSPPKGSPVGGSAPAPQSPQPANPHQKRHTVFEPDSAAPPPAIPQRSADFFANPPPPRPTFDPRDPFAAASLPPSRPAPAPVPAVMPPAPAPAAPAPAAPAPAQRPKARTIVETSNEGAAAQGRIRGALFEYRGSTDPGRVHPLRVGRNVLGRNPECDVIIDDGRVSGQHAFLFIRAEDASYMDVSSNGSIVNGAVVHGEQVVLQDQAVINLGGTTLVLVIVPEPLLARRSP